jgi:hypothetical protein
MRILRYIFYFMAVALAGSAQNPIVQTVFTADPAQLVYNDTLGKPLISPSQTSYGGHLWEDIDPMVLIDDDMK